MLNPLANKYDIGVIVGRFQVPELTEGHKHVIDNVLTAHKQLIIAIGVSPTLGTKKNPLGYTSRMHMLRSTYKTAIIVPIVDVNSDELWSKNLDTLIRSICPIGSICLYGSRDSFISSYKGIYSTFELGTLEKIEATKIREKIGKELIDSTDFRAGIIYQTQNQYPKVFPTVDIAVIKKEGKEYSVLMGKKNEYTGLQFPGGFVDPSDADLEEAALRELSEEVNVEVDRDSLAYLSSNRQEDWRYDSPDEVITTSLFIVNYVSGSGSPVEDELKETEWVTIDEDNYNSVADGHKPLFKSLMRKYNPKSINNIYEEKEDE